MLTYYNLLTQSAFKCVKRKVFQQQLYKNTNISLTKVNIFINKYHHPNKYPQ